MASSLNFNFLVLIPKIPNASSIENIGLLC